LDSSCQELISPPFPPPEISFPTQAALVSSFACPGITAPPPEGSSPLLKNTPPIIPRAFKRGETPLFLYFPLPLKGKGDKGEWGDFKIQRG